MDDAPVATLARLARIEEELQSLLDERVIRAILMRYCRGVDRCDHALIAGCFHDDARDDHGAWLASGAGIADHIIATVKPNSARNMHFVGNILIEVAGDTAKSESYLLALRAFERDGVPHTRTRATRMLDRFERRAGRWAIVERVLVDEWNRVDAVAETQDGTEHFRWGRKDGDDLVYALGREPLARTRLPDDHPGRA